MKYRALLPAVLVCFIACFSAYAFGSEDVYILGETKDEIYTNFALGIEGNFAGWRILSSKEIAALLGSASSSSPTFEQYTNGSVPVFAAVAGDGFTNVNIVITHLGAETVKLLSDPDGTFMDIFMDRSAQGLRQANAEMGADDLSVERVKARFAGEDYPGLFMQARFKSIVQYQKQAICIKGEYQYTITATCIGKDITDDVLAVFRKAGK